MFSFWKDARAVEMAPGIVRRTMATGERLMICEFRGKAGALVAEHSHPHEQAGYVASGEMDITIAGVQRRVGAGDSYVILGGQTHSVHFLTDMLIVETFGPPRDDFRA